MYVCMYVCIKYHHNCPPRKKALQSLNMVAKSGEYEIDMAAFQQVNIWGYDLSGYQRIMQFYWLRAYKL